MLALFQEHAQVFVITTMHLVIEILVKILVCAVVLERRSCLLVTWISLLDLRDLTPSDIFISGLWVVLFSHNKSVSHGHSFHQIFHGLHHHVEFFI